MGAGGCRSTHGDPPLSRGTLAGPVRQDHTDPRTPGPGDQGPARRAHATRCAALEEAVIPAVRDLAGVAGAGGLGLLTFPRGWQPTRAPPSGVPLLRRHVAICRRAPPVPTPPPTGLRALGAATANGTPAMGARAAEAVARLILGEDVSSPDGSVDKPAGNGGEEGKRTSHPLLREVAAVAGVPGLEPRLTGPEPVGLPITPHPKALPRCGRHDSRSAPLHSTTLPEAPAPAPASAPCPGSPCSRTREGSPAFP